MLHKRGDLKNFSKFTDKHKKQPSGGVLSRDVLKKFANFTDKYLCPSLFFNEVEGWKSETVRSSHWRCSVKKGVKFLGKLFCRTPPSNHFSHDLVFFLFADRRGLQPKISLFGGAMVN